jgi:hypothetical protein
MRKILTHLGEPRVPPPLSPARGPPTEWGELVQAHHDGHDLVSGVDWRGAASTVIAMVVYFPFAKAAERLRLQAQVRGQHT